MAVHALVIGRGPIAKVLLASLGTGDDVVAGVRGGEGDGVEVAIARARRRSSGREDVRRQCFPALRSPEAAGSRSWDLVITTAPLAADEFRALLRTSPHAAVASVTQVPSEVAALRDAAGGRPWGLAVPRFLAAGRAPVQWWQPGGLGFTVAGPATPQLHAALGGGAARHQESDVAGPLVAAATSMPFVAALQFVDYDWREPDRHRRSAVDAADQARAAVAAEYGAAVPRPLSSLAAGAALRVLPRLTPFDLSDYVRAHFGGHLAQTSRMLDDWIGLGRHNGLPVAAVESLRDRFAASVLEP